MAHLGYARVSTGEQNLDLQVDALNKAGCERVFQDHLSGTKDDRPGLAAAMAALRPGDCLSVWQHGLTNPDSKSQPLKGSGTSDVKNVDF
jgi:DNA invertase Pin-like site-specific DNA recombinase